MDQSNTIHSFVAVIGDIKDSRLLENRKEVQLRLQEVLEISTRPCPAPLKHGSTQEIKRISFLYCPHLRGI